MDLNVRKAEKKIKICLYCFVILKVNDDLPNSTSSLVSCSDSNQLLSSSAVPLFFNRGSALHYFALISEATLTTSATFYPIISLPWKPSSNPMRSLSRVDIQAISSLRQSSSPCMLPSTNSFPAPKCSMKFPRGTPFFGTPLSKPISPVGNIVVPLIFIGG